MFGQAQNQKHVGGLCVDEIKVKSAIIFSIMTMLKQKRQKVFSQL